jgi:plastocyanin
LKAAAVVAPSWSDRRFSLVFNNNSRFNFRAFMSKLRNTWVGLAALGMAGWASCAVDSRAMADETGTLKLTVTYGGPPPTPAPIKVNKDIEFCGPFNLIDESLVVNPENSGLKDVIMYVYSGRGKSSLPDYPQPAATHTLANLNCRFEPRVVVARTGDKILVTNPDRVGHNANMNFLSNKAVNFLIPPGSQKETDVLEKAEPVPIPVECNIHPWMRSFVVVMDHPFVGVSDVDGNLEIKDLPVGEHSFRIFHEGSGKIEEVKLGGKNVKTKRNVLTLDIKPGVNDLGKLEIPPVK